MFNKESDFEAALIQRLTEKCGWDRVVLKYKTEEDLIRNWQAILFENNRRRDSLNDVPLTDTEMGQIITQINTICTLYQNKRPNMVRVEITDSAASGRIP